MTEPLPDRVRGFLFEALDIRGAWVQLNDSWLQMIAGRDYPPPARALLGELAAATVLLTANLKHPGRMTFQLRGDGAVTLLIMDCTETLNVRGMVRGMMRAMASAPGTLGELVGSGALTLTLDSGDSPYQSHVPLEGETLAQAFEHYLARSEQTPTRLWLAASDHGVAGVLLQALPDADKKDPDGWNRLQILADTIRPDELLQLGLIKLIERVFPEEDVRVFDPRPVTYGCSYDPAKVDAMLRQIGQAECESVLAEQGEIRVHDEMCNHEYVLNADAVARLFRPPNTQEAPT